MTRADSEMRRAALRQRVINHIATKWVASNDLAATLGAPKSTVREILVALASERLAHRVVSNTSKAGLAYHWRGGAGEGGDDQAILTDDPSNIARQLKPRAPNLPGSRALATAQRDASCHIHLMQDDAHYTVRIHRMAISSDPLALPADFFRPSRDCGEPARRVVAPRSPKLTGFAALDSVRFELPAQEMRV